MSTIGTRSRLFEDHLISTETGESLCAVTMRPKAEAQRVILFVPLVGAGAGQQLLTFRSFSRRGAIVISYEYRGHPRSTGTFELDKTIDDTRDALRWASDYADRLGLPLHGFATCFGAIPLLAQFRKDGPGRLFRSISTISGLYHLNQILRVEDFAPIVSRYLGLELDAPALLAGIANHQLDCDSLEFRQALREYLSSLMPELRVDVDYFEDLKYDRVRRRQTLLQFSRADYLDGVNVPAGIPWDAYIGCQDVHLSAHTQGGRETYKNRVVSLVPHATVHELEFDHYGRGVDHDACIQRIGDTFERADRTCVPPCHLMNGAAQVAARLRSVPR